MLSSISCLLVKGLGGPTKPSASLYCFLAVVNIFCAAIFSSKPFNSSCFCAYKSGAAPGMRRGDSISRLSSLRLFSSALRVSASVVAVADVVKAAILLGLKLVSIDSLRRARPLLISAFSSLLAAVPAIDSIL